MTEILIECFGKMMLIEKCEDCPEYQSCLDSGWIEKDEV